jgi:hypothetical protein
VDILKTQNLLGSKHFPAGINNTNTTLDALTRANRQLSNRLPRILGTEI